MAPVSNTVVGIDDDQRFALMKFRRSVKDVLRPEHNDHFLLRWLRARQWDAEAAEKMLRDSLKWREKWGIDTSLLTWQPPEVLEKHFPSGMSGFDKEGSPVIVVPFVGLDVWGLLHSLTKTDVIRMILKDLEKYLAIARKQATTHGPAALKLTVIFDLEGFNVRQYAWKPAAEMVFTLLQLYEANYPEVLKTCFIVNAPKVFALAFSVVKKFMHEYTISKIKIFGTDAKKWQSQVLTIVDKDQIPEFYGGTMVDENGDPKCSSIIRPGGKVPKHYYSKNPGSESEKEYQRVTVKTGEKHVVDLLCVETDGVLKWDFGVDHYDIKFLIKRKDEEGNETVVHGPRKVAEGPSDVGILSVSGPATSLLSKDAIQLTGRKQRPSVQPYTTGKIKPLTLAEIMAKTCDAKKIQRTTQDPVSGKKRMWNSSVKVDKKELAPKRNHKDNSARKVLDFRTKPVRSVSNPRSTFIPEASKFCKPKDVQSQDQNSSKISGVFKIQETPIPIIKKPIHVTCLLDKENKTPKQSTTQLKPNHSIQSKQETPKLSFVYAKKQKIITKRLSLVLETPLPNDSFDSGEASFLENERKTNVLPDKNSKEQLAKENNEAGLPASTPFKTYRDVDTYFPDSSDLENSAIANDNTIMCLGKSSSHKENCGANNESLTQSLCDLMKDFNINNSVYNNTDPKTLINVKKEIENIHTIDMGIKYFLKIRDVHVKRLNEYVKLTNDNEILNQFVNGNEKVDSDQFATDNNEEILKKSNQQCRSSVIRTPSYKVPRKSLCLRKKIFHKTIVDQNSSLTPVKAITGKALKSYLKIKEEMNYLSTPAKITEPNVSATPSVVKTSRNLQTQLDQLYDEINS